MNADFEKELAHLINRHSIENELDMPDFLLARMLCAMIKSMGPTVKATLDWHGCDSVCHPHLNEEGNLSLEEYAELTDQCPDCVDGYTGTETDHKPCKRCGATGKYSARLSNAGGEGRGASPRTSQPPCSAGGN
jgi:hypothetical protein